MSVNMDAFIEEVRVRPAIYDITLPEYSDRSFKRHLWNQICQKFTGNWEELTEESRDVIGREMKNRWKSIRDAFVREVRYIKEAMKSGEPPVKKRKYIYYDQLAFLLPTVGVRGMKSQNYWFGAEDGQDTNGQDVKLENHSDHDINWTDFYREDVFEEKKRTRRNRGRRRAEKVDEDTSKESDFRTSPARKLGRPPKYLVSRVETVEDKTQDKPNQDQQTLDQIEDQPTEDQPTQDQPELQEDAPVVENVEEERLVVNPPIEDIVSNHQMIPEPISMYDSYDCRPPDHDYMFLLSLLPSLKKLGEEKKSIIKIEISSLIHEAIYGSTVRSPRIRLLDKN